ncbi:ATP-dependent RNA helicase SrmB [Aliidiomarina halalkaliphila]|uniref:ATP-dependent RNA helicase SrmB n=1 Tax=Aliidiomarina halalkaliphila TaxID=2593535 RepID=A0A552WZ72_9GAMM|nr:ATP-dependent RNA helicase SrmB [Aliidiomarina halalkaliphila]TRW48097.1 ATP-dependent RNA helicase SrmB [Aliidiomarina halalkaliphila]
MTPDWAELDLAPELIHALLERGLNKPTRIQQDVIPLAMDGRDIMATSPTGTGKTLAFLLPAIQHLLDYPRRDPGAARVLVLAPTRELAEQIGEQAEQLCAVTGLSCLTVTGGINFGTHLEKLRKNLDILIATPGRLLDYLSDNKFSAEEIEILVLDEADRMLDMGFRTPVEQIMNEAVHLKQRLLFSATADHSTLVAFGRIVLEKPEVVLAEPPKRERGKIHQWVHISDTLEHKKALLMHLVRTFSGRILVFVRKRERAHDVAEFLSQQGFGATALEGGLPQAERQERIKSFSSIRQRILVATDVAARGLDIADVELVVNFDLPRKGDTFLHRIGRTARAGKKGTAVALVEAHDAEHLGRIERYLGERLERRFVPELRPQFKFPDPEKSKKKKKKKKAGKVKAGKRAPTKSHASKKG